MSLSYSIESLLQSSKSDVNVDVESRADDVTSSACYSDIDDISDDEKSNSPESLAKKLDRHFKSNVTDDVRLRVNHRERQRMHDLNSALDSLRKTLPYSHGPSVKISKMATLILARNYILMLNKSLEEMRKLVTDVSMKKSVGVSVSSTCGLPSDRIPTLATSLPGSHLLRTSPFLSYDKTSICIDDVTKTSSHQPVTSYASPFLYTLPTYHLPNVTCHVNGGVAPLCPCNFCQVALATLPKSNWKQTCQ